MSRLDLQDSSGKFRKGPIMGTSFQPLRDSNRTFKQYNYTKAQLTHRSGIPISSFVHGIKVDIKGPVQVMSHPCCKGCIGLISYPWTAGICLILRSAYKWDELTTMVVLHNISIQVNCRWLLIWKSWNLLSLSGGMWSLWINYTNHIMNNFIPLYRFLKHSGRRRFFIVALYTGNPYYQHKWTD